MIEGIDYVKCKLCEYTAKQLHQHITKIHKMVLDEYKEKYSDDITCLNTKNKIGKASAEKFVKNPELRKIASKNGSKTMKMINETGQAFRMPKGYHTEEHKNYMKELMTGRDITWGYKIKENHWSNDEELSKKVTDKIVKKRRKNPKWNNPDRNNFLANWSLDNPDKCGPKMYKKGKHKNKKTNQYEYYRSNFELVYMKKYDLDDNIITYTVKHGIRIEYEYNDKLHSYIPDFLVEYKDGSKKIIELKGRVYDEGILSRKIEAAKQYCKNNNMEFEIIYQKDTNIR